MDAITLLKDDHKTVERLFKRFEKAGENAHAEKRKVAEQIRKELSIHAAIEEQLFYPVIRATVDDVEDVTLESLEEHHIVKWVLSELDDMDPKDERFTAKMTVLIENVRHHVEEEEDELFPKVRESLGRKDLGELGDAMQRAKGIAPTHPHPRSPDTPPGNLIVGAAAGAADKVGDTVRGAAQGAVSTAQDAAQGAVSTAQDVIGRIVGGRGDSSSSNGRSASRSSTTAAKRTAKRTARSAARSTSSATRKATGQARKASRSTKKAASGTAKKAASGTKTTARRANSTAKKAAGSTKSTAKRTANRAGSTAKKAAGVSKTTAKKAASNTRTAAKKTASTAKRSAAARR